MLHYARWMLVSHAISNAGCLTLWVHSIGDPRCFWWFTMVFSISWWASSSDMLIYPSIFAFPLLPLHHQSTTTHSNCTWSHLCLHLLHRTNLTYLMDTWFMIHLFLLLFLVSPMCALPWSDQSRALTPHGQALCFGWALCSLSCLPFVFNLPVFYLSLRPSSEKNHTITYMSFPQNWDLALAACTISHLSHTILHHNTLPHNPTVFTLHHTWRWSLSPRSHPQSLIGFILRSPAP